MTLSLGVYFWLEGPKRLDLCIVCAQRNVPSVRHHMQDPRSDAIANPSPSTPYAILFHFISSHPIPSWSHPVLPILFLISSILT